MRISLRKHASAVSVPRAELKFQVRLAHLTNSVSCVTPRSSVIASYFVRPGDLRLVLGSPPSRCSTTSVVRLRAPHLLIPATYRPSHFTRNLKFLYGSNLCGLTENCAICAPPLDWNLTCDLLDFQDDELGRLQWRESYHDIDD